MIKAIIFDYFGVIGTDVITEIVNSIKIREPHKAEQVVQLVHSAFNGINDPEITRIKVANMLGLSLEEYKNKIKNGESRNQPLLDYIKALRPRFKTGLLSNMLRGGLQARFSSDELAMYFDEAVSSGEIGYAKPEAQAYEIIADRLGVRLLDCVMIDDREDYCIGARSVGMQAIQYKSFEQMKRDLQKYLK